MLLSSISCLPSWTWWVHRLLSHLDKTTHQQPHPAGWENIWAWGSFTFQLRYLGTTTILGAIREVQRQSYLVRTLHFRTVSTVNYFISSINRRFNLLQRYLLMNCQRKSYHDDKISTRDYEINTGFSSR